MQKGPMPPTECTDLSTMVFHHPGYGDRSKGTGNVYAAAARGISPAQTVTFITTRKVGVGGSKTARITAFTFLNLEQVG